MNKMIILLYNNYNIFILNYYIMSKKTNIIGKNTLPFKRDNQKGGILFGKISNPLKDLFSSVNTSVNTKATNNFVNATKSKSLNSSRKTIRNIKGGYLTNHFFPQK